MAAVDNLYTWDLPLMTQGHLPMINYRKDAKRAVKFTFMVVGELGTGKTTFVNCLLNKPVLAHRFATNSAAGTDTKTLAFTSVQLVALPSTAALTKADFNPDTANEEPGIALTETKIEMVDELQQRLLLNVIDAPGFGENLDNEICFVELENYLKQQFDLVLAEETRIRRNPRFTDTRVHVLLYFITPTGHGLREIDILAMKRLSKYVNIIPVIGRADSFTERELAHFKQQIRSDIEHYNVPVFQFDSYLDEYDQEQDYELIEECKFLARLQPFAVVASEDIFDVRDQTTGELQTVRGRRYPWGVIDVNNPKYLDFLILKLVLLGLHLQDLKDLTHDFLYEQYRTERLTTVTGGESNLSAPKVVNLQPPAAPSLSNLAQLTKQDSAYLETETLLLLLQQRTKKLMLLDEDEEDDDHTHDGHSIDGGSQSELIPLPRIKDDELFALSIVSDEGAGLRSTNSAFKRMLIAPQRSQLRQISETVPYVLKHEQILERQHKLEELEMASAKELASRAAMLEQKAQQLKAQERLLLKRLEAKKREESEAASIKAATQAHLASTSEVPQRSSQSITRDESTLQDGYPAPQDESDYENAVEHGHELDNVEPEEALLEPASHIKKDETLTDLHTVVSDGR